MYARWDKECYLPVLRHNSLVVQQR
jgi:hypothetical protein